MSTTFNQIPPISEGQLFYNIQNGVIVFADSPEPLGQRELIVYRDRANLVLKCDDIEYRKIFRDHDDTVDEVLRDFFVLATELPDYGILMEGEWSA